MARVTIQDIAKEMSLSRNTVSLALKGSNVVSEETRRRVREYAVRAGYLKRIEPERQESPEYLIMVLRRPNEAVFWDKIMSGIMKEARLHNWLVQVAVVMEEDIAQERLPVGYDKVDALIFMNVFPESYAELLVKNGKYGIFLDDRVSTDNSVLLGDMIKSEGIRSVQCITRQLIAQGLRQIEFLSSTDVEECQTVNDRLIGYSRAMEEADLPATTLEELRKVNECNIYDVEALSQWIKKKKSLPEAFVCANDIIAQGLIKVLRENGKRVPEDVAVVGFDNEESRSADAFITTADFNAEWLGCRLVMQILWRMSHPDAPYEAITVDSKVIFRQSSNKTAKK